MKFEQCKARSTAKERNPSHWRVIKVQYGFMVFFNREEYETWLKKK